MKTFRKNKSQRIMSVFDNCRWEIPRSVNIPSSFTEAVLQEQDYQFKLNTRSDKKCFMTGNEVESENFQTQDEVGTMDYSIDNEPYKNESEDGSQSISEKLSLAWEQPKMEQVQNAPAPTQLPYTLQETIPIKRNTMQIMEDHLLSKVSIRRLYGGIYLYNGKYYIPLTEQDYSILIRRKSDDGIISILKNYRAFSDGYRFLSSNPDIEFDNYVTDSIRFKTFIAFENTLLDARTGKQYKHNPDYPVFFGVNACYVNRPTNTPCWDAFLHSASNGDEKIKQLIYEMLGYLLLQGNDGKCFFVLATAPNSGKSLMGDFIGELFPDAYISHMAINDFGERFSLGGLWKTLVNVSMDLPQSTLSTNTVSLIKTLTGDSKITAEEKYMPKCTALNRLKLVFGTNSRISISAPDSAFWDRVIIVPFLNEIPRKKRISDLLSHFIAEKDDILSKSIPYVTKLIEKNYDFVIPDAAIAMKWEWSGNIGDSIGNFFTEYCVITDTACGISVQELFDCYQEYCLAKSILISISDVANFSKIITQRYQQVKKGKHRVDGKSNPVSVFENVKCSYANL